MAIEEDETAINNLEIALGSAEDLLEVGGWSDNLEAAEAAVAAAEADDAQLVRLRDAVAQGRRRARRPERGRRGTPPRSPPPRPASLLRAPRWLTSKSRTPASCSPSSRSRRPISDDDSDPIAEAQGRLSEASSIARGVAEERAWLKVVIDLQAAQSDLDEAEERFAVGLPIALGSGAGHIRNVR